MQVAIDKFGRMVLPKSLRDDLDLAPGDTLEASGEEGAIVLRPTHKQNTLKLKGKWDESS